MEDITMRGTLAIYSCQGLAFSAAGPYNYGKNGCRSRTTDITITTSRRPLRRTASGWSGSSSRRASTTSTLRRSRPRSRPSPRAPPRAVLTTAAPWRWARLSVCTAPFRYRALHNIP
jgi:hypothetical protein